MRTSIFYCHIDIVAYPTAHHVDEGAEHKEYPDDTKDIEEHVSQRSTARLGIC